MAGYNYAFGMSNNAIGAYTRGVKPLSRIRAEDLSAAGVNISLKFAVWLAKEGWWRPSEWHHSGGTWYNEVDFYDPEFLADLIRHGDIDLDVLEAEFKNSCGGDDRRVKGQYTVWGGSRRRPRVIGHEDFTGTLRGNWIHLDGGGKKRADGKHISWEYIDDPEQ